MKPLASLLCVWCLLLKTSCGYNETDLEYLRDLWMNAARRTNESLLRQQSLHGDDFNQLIDVLSNLKTTDARRNIIQDVKTAIVRNGYESTLGVKLGMFTNYCGPGDKAGPSNATVCGVFGQVDNCCRSHDACASYIGSKNDFKRFPELPQRHLYFTSLTCDCDVAFYNCIKQTATFFGELILGIYSVAQMSCFQYEYKIEKCIKYDDSLIFRKRCLQYRVNKRLKQWQWFDLPYSSSNTKEYSFPRLKF